MKSRPKRLKKTERVKRYNKVVFVRVSNIVMERDPQTAFELYNDNNNGIHEQFKINFNIFEVLSLFYI